MLNNILTDVLKKNFAVILITAMFFIGSFFALSFLAMPYALAAVTVTLATGGSAISADTTGGAYTSLTGPVISEGAVGDVNVGTIILNVPTGFVFDTGGTAPTVKIVRTSGQGADSRNINGVADGTDVAITSISTSQITFTVTSAGTNGVKNSLTWQNVRVRPSAVTPLASGNITKTGTSSIIGVTNGVTNFGTLTEVAGAADTTAPAAVSNLALSSPSNSAMTVSWTAPGDDGSTGTATSYDLRYSTSAITDGNFSSATAVTGEPAPSVAGSSESMSVTGLSPSTTYFFAIKTSDEVPNTSAISNVPSLATTAMADTTAPAAISDLAASSPSNSAITLSWTSPGDDGSSGTATSYDIRYSTSIITSGNWASAASVSDEPTPLVAGTSQSKTVTGLSPSTTYYFAMKTSDEVPNESALSNVPSLATTATADTTAPAAVSYLSLSEATAISIKLTWTSPGDDGSSGTASSYDIRYSTALITSANWSSATQVSDEPAPQVAGTSQSMTVSGLSAATTYFFAIKTSDEVPNESALSNVPSLATAAASSETVVPAAPAIIQKTVVHFYGRAYPGAIITLLEKSGSQETPVQQTKTASSDGSFSVKIEGFFAGYYSYGLKVADKEGRFAPIKFYDMDIGPSSVNERNIFIPPTLGLAKPVVFQGDEAALLGYATPKSELKAEVDGKSLGKFAVADASGFYRLAINTQNLSQGSHTARVRQSDTSLGVESDWSISSSFIISTSAKIKADFNKDGKVSIADWSIFLFRWGSRDQKLRSEIDMDGNGKIDVIDLSIFLKTIQI